ncbi:hypothetical protein D3C73_1623850 [compost metagenome]
MAEQTLADQIEGQDYVDGEDRPLYAPRGVVVDNDRPDPGQGDNDRNPPFGRSSSPEGKPDDEG